ncbi:velvet factor-domain-containing protein [Limtongia smithiae]|uniref:velvet factor-domain-containing protein n=1 Tax=Limtongia smithiae TaxID=1125753 RepID=UPI0034D001E7
MAHALRLTPTALAPHYLAPPPLPAPFACEFRLEIAQQPVQARASGWGTRSDTCRPVDPPPVVNFYVLQNGVDITSCCKNSFILHATLLNCSPPAAPVVSASAALAAAATAAASRSGITDPIYPAQAGNLIGATSASLNFMRHPPPGRAYFLFRDLSVRQEGSYRLTFSLFEICEDVGAIWRAETVSDPLTVYSPKRFPGLDVSSALTREIASQGGKVRIRREARPRTKRQNSNPAVAVIAAAAAATAASRAASAVADISQSPDRAMATVSDIMGAAEEYTMVDGKRKSLDATADYDRTAQVNSMRSQQYSAPHHGFANLSDGYSHYPYQQYSPASSLTPQYLYPYHPNYPGFHGLIPQAAPETLLQMPPSRDSQISQSQQSDSELQSPSHQQQQQRRRRRQQQDHDQQQDPSQQPEQQPPESSTQQDDMHEGLRDQTLQQCLKPDQQYHHFSYPGSQETLIHMLQYPQTQQMLPPPSYVPVSTAPQSSVPRQYSSPLLQNTGMPHSSMQYLYSSQSYGIDSSPALLRMPSYGDPVPVGNRHDQPQSMGAVVSAAEMPTAMAALDPVAASVSMTPGPSEHAVPLSGSIPMTGIQIIPTSLSGMGPIGNQYMYDEGFEE